MSRDLLIKEEISAYLRCDIHVRDHFGTREEPGIIKLFAWGEELCTRSCSNKHAHRDSGGVCVYCCNTYYKAVREDLCVFITAVPITKLFAWGGG